MTETVMLPSNASGLVQTDNGHSDHGYKDYFLFQGIKDAQVENVRTALDVKNHVSTEAAATRLMIAEHTRRTEDLIRNVDTTNIRAALQDAKDEVTALKLTAKATPTI
jgi:hypothetical protein